MHGSQSCRAPLTDRMNLSADTLQLVPAWRGDETLYSWCAGFHRLHQTGSSKQTGEQLFGAAHTCRLTEIPSRLGAFEERTGGRLGSAQQLLAERTLFAYHSCLLPGEQRRRAATAAISTDDPATARVRLGLVARGGALLVNLKDCVQCNEESRLRYGIPTWRLEHQFPFAMTCLRHSIPLRVASARTATWALPDDIPAAEVLAPRDDKEMTHASILCRIEWSFHRNSGRCTQDAFRRGALQALARIGVVKPHLRIDAEAITEWLVQSPVYDLVGTAVGWAPPSGFAERLLKGRTLASTATWSILWAAIAAVADEAEEWLERAFRGGVGVEQISL